MGFVCKRQGTWIKPPNQLNFTLTDTSCPDLLLVWWFTVSLGWLGGNQRSCVGTKSLQGSVQSVLLCWDCSRERQGNSDLQEEPSPDCLGHTARQPCRQGWDTAPASPRAALPRACASGTHTQTLPHLPLAVTASSTQGNIPPMDWEELQLFCFILLCPQCAITQNTES